MSKHDRMRPSAPSDVARIAREGISAARNALSTGVIVPTAATSGSARQFISRTASAAPSGSQRSIVSSAGFGLTAARPGTPTGPKRPELDRVEVFLGSAGVNDRTQCKVVFSVEATEISRIRIAKVLRADLGPSPLAGYVSPRGLSALSPQNSVRKEQDSIYRTAVVLSASSVSTTLTAVVKDIAGVGQRSTAGASDKLRVVKPRNQSNRKAGSGDLYRSDQIDQTVTTNLQFYRSRRAAGDSTGQSTIEPLSVGARVITQDLRHASVSPIERTVESNLVSVASPFVELSSIGIDETSGVLRGDFIEMSVDDLTVAYGRRYAYYVVLIDSAMNQSVRSRVVPVDVLILTPPVSPSVSYLLVADRPRFSISSPGAAKFEIYIRGTKRSRPGTVVGTTDSFVGVSDTETLANGFRPAIEVQADSRGDATFVDAYTIPGEKLTYRIYAVGPFNAKAQTPFECEITIPDRSRRITIKPPIVSVDRTQDGKPKLSVTTDERDIVGFFVVRRDVTIDEHAFHTPNQPAFVSLTQRDSKRRCSSEGARIVSPIEWRGFIEKQEQVTEFVDNVVSLDRVYQYAVQACDRRGMRSDQTVTRRIGVYVATPSLAPTALAAVYDGNAVTLTWTAQDRSLDETFSGQQQSLFQVERRRSSDATWLSLPVVQSQSYVDVVGSGLEKHERYAYRVSSIDRDGNQSSFSSQVEVLTDVEPEAPASLRVRSTPLAVRPALVVVSWVYNGSDVDRWEIERAAVNKIAASKLTSVTPGEIAKLNFIKIATVCRESSRAVARTADKTLKRDTTVFMGNRSYVDSDISLENSYFYRVRAISNGGLSSGWSVRGVLLVDSPFDRKFMSMTSKNERAALAKTARPAVLKGRMK